MTVPGALSAITTTLGAGPKLRANFGLRVRSIEWMIPWGVAAIAAVAAVIYFWTVIHHPGRPRSPQELGVFTWFDQSWYYKAVLAWAKGDLDPSQHLYLPGYPLLGAAFAGIMPLEPFFFPNAICLLLALWLFSHLTARLAPELPLAKLVGAAIFLACSVLSATMLDVWVVPWTSSGSAPLVYGCLLAAVIFVTTPVDARWAFLAALAAGGVAFFRPADSTPLVIACALGMETHLLLSRPGWPAALRVIFSGLAGGAISLGLFLAIYVSIYGLQKSHYVNVVGMFGFDWQLIPLRWVTLFLDPRPLVPEGEGLIHRFPYIVTGIAGCVAILSLPSSRSRWLADSIVIGAVVLHVAFYLSFRDLGPSGLFRFYHYHLFKWVLPVLGLYSVRFIWMLIAGRRRWLTATLGAVPLVILLPWRVELRPVDRTDVPTISGNTVRMNADLTDLRNTVLVPTVGEWDALYMGSHSLAMTSRTWGYTDFRLWKQPSGSMLVLLRPLEAGEGRLTPAKMPLRSDGRAVYARRHFVLGRPCFFQPDRPNCFPTELLPPADYATPSELPFDGRELPYLSAGWSIPQNGRWTDGKLAALRFRLPDLPTGSPLQVEIEAGAYMPAGADPLRIRLSANKRQLESLTIAHGRADTIRVLIPADLIDSDRRLSLAIKVDNPRSPSEFAPSPDQRELGLFVTKLRISQPGSRP